MRRLSALTLAALATGYHPDGSAPEPGFPRRWLTGVLPASRKGAAVKHAPCGPVLMPVDRGPESRPSADGNPPAGTASRSRLYGLPFRKGALETNEMGRVMVIAAAKSKALHLCRWIGTFCTVRIF